MKLAQVIIRMRHSIAISAACVAIWLFAAPAAFLNYQASFSVLRRYSEILKDERIDVRVLFDCFCRTARSVT